MSGRQQPVVRPAEAARMMTVADVAAILGVSPMTIRREIERGRMRGYRIGHATRVRADDLGEYMRRAVVGGDA